DLYVPNVALYQAELHPESIARAKRSVVAFDGEICEFAQGLLVRRLGQFGEGLDGKGGLLPREPRSVRKAPGRFNCNRDGRQLCCAAHLDAAPDDAALILAAGPQRIYKRKRRLAFGQVVAEDLAELLSVRAVVQHVVDQLKRSAGVADVAGHRALDG